jgi:hypothetical protein
MLRYSIYISDSSCTMATNLKVIDYKNGKLITIGSPLNNRVKVLDFLYALTFLTGAVVFVVVLTGTPDRILMATIIILFGIAVSVIAFFRFINKATETEKVFVNKETLEIISSGLLNARKRSFLMENISDFKFNELEKFKPHPLKGDYPGFQTGQYVIQDLHANGRISFNYNGKQERFGRDIMSWEFSELEVLLYDAAGGNLKTEGL